MSYAYTPSLPGHASQQRSTHRAVLPVLAAEAVAQLQSTAWTECKTPTIPLWLLPAVPAAGPLGPQTALEGSHQVFGPRLLLKGPEADWPWLPPPALGPGTGPVWSSQAPVT